MKTMHDAPREEQLHAAAAAPGGRPLTLADEHALLLEQVAIRAEDVLAVAAQNLWPARELRRLLGYLRVEVLRQAEDEEMLLFASLGASACRAGWAATMRACARPPRRWNARLPVMAPGPPPGSPR